MTDDQLRVAGRGIRMYGDFWAKVKDGLGYVEESLGKG